MRVPARPLAATAPAPDLTQPIAARSHLLAAMERAIDRLAALVASAGARSRPAPAGPIRR
jgi:hypothetical protein